MKWPFLFAVGITLTLGPAQARADFSCSDVLRWGLFNEESLHSYQMSASSFHTWQCTNEVNSRDEALKVGFGLKAIIEGLPFDAAGNVDKARRDAWRRANCSEEDRNSSWSTSLDQMTKTASSAILTAWNTCVRDVASQRQNGVNGLICRAEHGDARQVEIALGRMTSSDNRINVKSVQLFGAKDPTVIKLQEFPIPLTSFPVERPEIRDGRIPELRLVINTDAGRCVATFPEFVDVHQGNVILGSFEMSQDYTIRAEKVVLPDGLSIKVGRGARLLIEAHEVEIGDNVLIDGTGGQGRNGAPAPEPVGEQFNGENADRDACSDALRRNQSTRGAAGQNGADGEPGATIEILTGKVSGPGVRTIKVKNGGGPGGKGGMGARYYKRMLCVAGGHIRWDAPMGIEGYAGRDGNTGRSGPPPIIGGAIRSHFVDPPSAP